jgi:hypothetical protein
VVIQVTPWPHLARRFFATLVGRVRADDLTFVDRYLTARERSLFLTMSSADQRHSVALCERLRRDGHDDVILLRAALLHDVGKATARLPIFCRVVHSFAAVSSPRLAGWLTQSDKGWRRPFYVAANHAVLGAAAAARAGSGEEVVRLIAGHGARGDDPLSQTLHDYDRRI